MNLSDFVASFDRNVIWKCTECKKEGTVTFKTHIGPEEAIQNIQVAHHNATYNFKLKEETCSTPEFEIEIIGK